MPMQAICTVCSYAVQLQDRVNGVSIPTPERCPRRLLRFAELVDSRYSGHWAMDVLPARYAAATCAPSELGHY
jgi:hypothetical protein